MGRYLEVGSGGNPQPGYIHMDRFVDCNTRHLVDLLGNAFNLPFKCSIFDGVLLFGVFEHFGYYEIQEVLLEIVRVLKPGGSLKFDVPDFDWFVTRYFDRAGIDPVRDDEWFLKAIYGGQDGPGMFHKWGWNEKRLRDFLSKPNWGFSEVKLVGRQWRDPEENHLIWECTKAQ